MSRIGNMPITVPAGVTVTVAEGNNVTVKGSLGTLTNKFSTLITIKQDANVITLTRANDEDLTRSLHGLTRALLADMVIGVSAGYSKTLKIEGIGYKATKSGKNLQLFLGHSLMPTTGLPQAKFIFPEENGITFDVPDQNTIVVKGIDKQAVGQIAAVIRSKRPPEPYHGKGVLYEGEHVRRKAGKTGK